MNWTKIAKNGMICPTERKHIVVETKQPQTTQAEAPETGKHKVLWVVLICLLTVAIVVGGLFSWFFLLRPTYSWQVSEDGTLTISGITTLDWETKELVVTGTVPAFSSKAPWDKQADAITAVYVDNTVVDMADSALSGLTHVTQVNVPGAMVWNGIEQVPVPPVEDHHGQWRIADSSSSRIRYEVEYREIFTVTFQAEDGTVTTVDYVDGDESVEEPSLPEKDGYTATWGSYKLEGDITVTPVYTYNIWTGITTARLNLHSQPGGSSSGSVISSDTVVAVLDMETVDGTAWCRIADGWIAAEYLSEQTYVEGSLADHIGVTTSEGYVMSDETAAWILRGIQIFSNKGFNVGFMLLDIETGETITYNADQSFYGASTIKGPYVVAALNKHPKAATDFYGTIQEILVNSSDDYYFKFRNTYGRAPMEEWCALAGVDAVVSEKYFPDMTARQLCDLWVQNYDYFTTADNGKTVASWFQRPEKSPIRTVLGGKYTTQTKAGWIEGTTDHYQAANDAGIVYADNGTYILVIMSDASANLTMLNTLVGALDTAHTEMRS